MALGSPPLSAGSRARGSTQVAKRDYTGPRPQGRMGPRAHLSPRGAKAALTALGFGTSCPQTSLVLKQSTHKSYPRIAGTMAPPGQHTQYRAQPGSLSTFSLLLPGLHSLFSMRAGQFAQGAANQTQGVRDIFKAPSPSPAQTIRCWHHLPQLPTSSTRTQPQPSQSNGPGQKMGEHL